MHEVNLLVTAILASGGILGCFPLVLLFVDYRRRNEIHKPFIYLAVFGFTMCVALPMLLKAFGLWLALMAPFAVLGYVFLARSSPRRP